MPETTAFSMVSISGSSKLMSVPAPEVKLESTLTGTLYLLANSTALTCITLAPWPESSNISSIVILSNFFASGTTFGSVV